ncbi:nucleoporin complex subunit 54-domain-containing protein [Butyriboletus roseoflavus]|nr:nucleoporin complex subunit 54-domain-containing protein [Butyriboletus roseoflavus]
MGSTLFGNPTSQQQSATGNSLFGSTNPPQQQPTTGGGLFGGTVSSQQPSATGGGLFGGTTQPATVTGGSIFGSATQPAATRNIFGNTTQAAAGGSIFSSTTQPATGGSIFGGTNTQQSQQSAGSSLFGTATTQPQQSGGNLFGTSTNTLQQPTAGGLFGTTNVTTQPTAGPFGSTMTAPAPGGGLFGSSTSSSNPLFGNKAPSSIFGAPATGTSTGTGTSTISPPTLFGQPATQTSTSTAQPPTPLFGQPAQQQPQKLAGSLFGSTTQPSTTGTLFGSNLAAPAWGTGLGTGSILGTSTSRSSQSTLGATAQQQDPQNQFVALVQRIDAIAEAWNPNSSLCRFQHYFYNLVDPAVISQYGRPANATNEALWQRAVRENPDHSCMVPVLAVGFDALNARVEAQSAQATAQQEKLKELRRRLQALTATHTDTTLSRLHRALSQHTQLSQRLLRLVQHLHLLIPAVRSSSIRPEEEALRVALEEMEEDLRRPGGMSKMRSKLNELWALVGAINAAMERGKKAGGEGAVEWTVVDEEGLKQITQILSDQQAGLQHLTKILQRDLKDLGVIMGTNGEREDGHRSADMRLSTSPSLLNSSTSTLHASVLR